MDLGTHRALCRVSTNRWAAVAEYKSCLTCHMSRGFFSEGYNETSGAQKETLRLSKTEPQAVVFYQY